MITQRVQFGTETGMETDPGMLGWRAPFPYMSGIKTRVVGWVI